jgi:hypothetical protein
MLTLNAGESGAIARRMLDDLTDFSTVPIKYIFEV